MEEQKKPAVGHAAPAFSRGGDRRDSRRPMRRRPMKEQDEFDQRMIDLSRVTRVMAGGKRMRFRACMVVGDRNGRVGWGVAKGADVSMAMQKAVTQAKKNLITVSITNGTIPHDVHVKFKAARLLLKPAKQGKGLIAGGVVRTVLELGGVKNIISKIHGSNNKINNVAATFKALSSLRRVEPSAPKVAPEPKTESAQPGAPKRQADRQTGHASAVKKPATRTRRTKAS